MNNITGTLIFAKSKNRCLFTQEESYNTLSFLIVFMAQAFLIRCGKHTFIAHYIWCASHTHVLRIWCAIHTCFFTVLQCFVGTGNSSKHGLISFKQCAYGFVFSIWDVKV